MKTETILQHVDHTLLDPTAQREQVLRLCTEASEHRMASVCLPPCYVGYARTLGQNSLTIGTVVGFPMGYQTTYAKLKEAETAVEMGVDEVDMVVNLCDVKNGDWHAVSSEISQMRQVLQGKVFKVILEMCYLSEEEKIRLCQHVTGSGADYLKTSTGFGPGGATLEDVALMRRIGGKHMKIKASGGIRTREAFCAFIEAGCDRIGSSRAVEALIRS